MKLSKRQSAKESQTPAKVKAGVVQSHVGKSTNRTGGRCPKPVEKTKKILKVEPVPEHKFHPSSKIKLQLFPMDDVIKMALEKDGYHPYLELTLSSKKKISSVVKHLTDKWGCSSIASAEPVLFPYISSKGFPSRRWTKKDDDITAGDVHMLIGSPSVFRLRYGWLSDSENKSSGVPSTSTPFNSFWQPKEMQHVIRNNLGSTCSKQKQAKDTIEDLKPTILSGCGAEDVSGANKMSSDRSIELPNEVKMNAGIGQTSSLWDDSLTNISIGGLLSEASLQGRFSNDDNPKSDGTNAGLQPSQIISDSFDAFLMAQANYSSSPRLPPHGSTSSILDAEDTCHAFAFQKNSSSSKDVIALGGTVFSNNCSQDSIFKSFKHPNGEANVQSSVSQGRDSKESETDLSLGSRIYQDESSLGLSGIKWVFEFVIAIFAFGNGCFHSIMHTRMKADSLGPFDLGLSSRKIINGDSLSISRIFN